MALKKFKCCHLQRLTFFTTVGDGVKKFLSAVGSCRHRLKLFVMLAPALVKTLCIWPHFVQGHVYSSLSPPSPPLSPPSNVITRAVGLRAISAPPLSPPPPQDYGQILAASPKVEDGLRFGDCEYDS